LIDASARLINVGATSPSWPALSSAAAFQSDSTVPTSWAKHSVQFRSTVGLPPSLDQPQHFYLVIKRPTRVQIIEFQEISFLVELVGVAIKILKNWYQFGFCISSSFHWWLLKDHRPRSRRCDATGNDWRSMTWARASR
jgi:hypothetical protein